MTDDSTDPAAPHHARDVRALPPGDDVVLRSWWTSEIRRAESDILAGRARGAVARPLALARTVPAVLGIAALIAALTLVGVMARPPTGPAATSSRTLVPSGTRVPPSNGSDVFGVDGIPTMIAGERVLRVPELNDGVPHTTGPFLVGGWAEGNVQLSCGIRLAPASQRGCPGGFGLADAPPAVGRPSASFLLLTAGEAPANQGALVVRVAVDPAAKNCSSVAQCPVNPYDLESVIWRWTPPTPIFADRWPDGIPSVMGTDVVTRPADAARNARLLRDDEPFFVAGWLHDPLAGQPAPCPASLSFLVPTCGGIQLADTPGGQPADLDLAFPTNLEPAPSDGPVILRVHAQDRRAALCPSALRIACRRALVVEAVVWTGDDWTATRPLDILTVLFRLGAGQTGAVTALDAQPAACIPALPHETYLGAPGMTVGRIAVFPTTTDRERFVAAASAGWIAGTQPDGAPCRSPIAEASSWVSVDNAAVEVREPDGATITLIERAVLSLEASPVP
jgi:hypothetical protein